MYKNAFKFAFTLAEVLIVLGIIGIIAALTIPTLINNIQKNETVTRLKAAYTKLYQAIKLSEIDNGPTTDWDYGSGTYEDTLKFVNTYLKPYLKYSKIQKDTILGSVTSVDIYLNDGVVLLFYYASEHMHVHFILNGEKPDSPGKTRFIYFIGCNDVNQKHCELRPYDYRVPTDNVTRDDWIKNPDYGCNKTSVSKPYCAGLIMYDGWKIAPDYPW